MSQQPATIVEWFCSRSAWNRQKAAQRAAAVFFCEQIERCGATYDVAIFKTARMFKTSETSVKNWKRRVAGIASDQYIYHLCDRRGS